MTTSFRPQRRRDRRSVFLAGGPALAVGLLASLAAGPPAPAAVPARLEIAVADPRPLAAAADEMERRFGIPVSYEDPPYSDPADVVESEDVAGVLIPAGTDLAVEYGFEAAKASGPMLDPGSILEALVQQHAAKDEPGRFRVEEAGGMYFIIPEEVKQGKAGLAPITPILDAVIELPPGFASALTRLEEIADAVRAANGAQLELGLAPLNLLARSTVSLGGGALTARDYLAALSAALPRPVTWRLFYSIDLETYFLSLQMVPSKEKPVLGLQTPPPNSFSGE